MSSALTLKSSDTAQSCSRSVCTTVRIRCTNRDPAALSHPKDFRHHVLASGGSALNQVKRRYDVLGRQTLDAVTTLGTGINRRQRQHAGVV
jgi:hypothetical protein